VPDLTGDQFYGYVGPAVEVEDKIDDPIAIDNREIWQKTISAQRYHG